MPRPQAPSPRTRVRRLPDRAHYDATTVAAIIDSAWMCTIAFAWDGSVHALPTIPWRDGDYLYIHGAKASRMLKALQDGEASVAVGHVDGLVYARSAFHHSMNYRSVVVYGRFEAVHDPAAKVHALKGLIDKLAPRRWDQLRPIHAKEINATTVLRLPLAEASVKIRDWGVKDDEEDMSWPVWAGVVPLTLVAGVAQTDPASCVTELPDYLLGVD